MAKKEDSNSNNKKNDVEKDRKVSRDLRELIQENELQAGVIKKLIKKLKETENP